MPARHKVLGRLRVLEPACDEQQHGPSYHASPSKWDSPTSAVPQAQRRRREYLTPKEVERLIAAETVDPGARRRGAGPPLWRGPAHFLATTLDNCCGTSTRNCSRP